MVKEVPEEPKSPTTFAAAPPPKQNAWASGKPGAEVARQGNVKPSQPEHEGEIENAPGDSGNGTSNINTTSPKDHSKSHTLNIINGVADQEWQHNSSNEQVISPRLTQAQNLSPSLQEDSASRFTSIPNTI